MYGNPVQDIKKIHTELSKNNIVLIEDCASLMTNIESDVMPGTEGDYVIYSTGYSKTIDVGYGGLLFSKNYSLSSMEKCLDELPLLNDEFEKETALFSKIYRIIRNQRHESKLAIDFYDGGLLVLLFSFHFFFSPHLLWFGLFFSCIFLTYLIW